MTPTCVSAFTELWLVEHQVDASRQRQFETRERVPSHIQ